VGDIDFKVISAAENSNKFPKNQVLEGEICRGCGNTWANGTGHTSIGVRSFSLLRNRCKILPTLKE